MHATTGPIEVVVVGGGLVGLATARALHRAHPGIAVTVLEKEADVGMHQSGHNSGVLHAGLYYRPGSLKATLAVRGIRAMRAFCASRGIPFETCGKLVVANGAREIARLDDLLARGTANGLRGVRRLVPAEAREIEPHVRCDAALLVPEEGIVDFPAVARTITAELRRDGARVMLGRAVTGAIRDRGRWRIEADAETFTADFVVNCAGLHADRVARLFGASPRVRIVPFRGEYFLLEPGAAGLVRHLIYPTPDPAFPFLGVHFTRMIGGGVECGPNAVLALHREGYSWRHVSLRDSAGSLAFPGLWRFLARYPRMATFELARSASRRLFARSLQALVPAIRSSDLRPGGAGVRAQAMGRDGALIQDFAFEETEGALHVLNAPSPGATAALAIGDALAARICPAIGLAVRDTLDDLD